MPLESATYISDLVPTNPAGTDQVSQADDHLRLIKATLKATFPNITGPVTASQAALNSSSGSVLTSVTPATNTFPWFDSATTANTATITAFGRSFLAQTSAANALASLGAQPSGSYAGTATANTFTGNQSITGLLTVNQTTDGSNLIALSSAGTTRGYLLGSASYAFAVANTGGTNLLTVNTTGDLTASGNVSAYSDLRIKKDIEVIDDALDIVEKISGVRYTRRDSGAHRVGVIAQEVRQVLPEVVLEDPETGYLSVNYGDIVGVLIEAIKDLKYQVVDLHHVVAGLQRKLNGR